LTSERTTSLLFAGDLALWQGILLAGILSTLVWILYRREVSRNIQPPLTWLLPLLRTIAIVLLLFTLTGPVLHHREKIGQLGRILLFIDGSTSMSVDDAQMMPGPRKLLSAQQNGWLPKGTVDTTLATAADSIATAQATLNNRLRGSKLSVDAFLKARSEFKERLKGVQESIAGINVDRPEPELREGLLFREVWQDINGGSIGNLTQNPKFKKDADSTEYISEFDSPKNVGENYGQRISGYLIPPLTGNYQFTLQSDDQSILYLNPGGNAPKGKKELLQGGISIQTSQPIQLKAETPCYVEVLMKEAGGDDYVTVGWKLPNGENESPIPANRLASPASGVNLLRGDFQTLAKRYHENIIKRIEPTSLPKPDDANAIDRLRSILIATNGVSQEYESFLRNAFLSQGEALVKKGDAQINAALAKFDDHSRFQRAKNLLTRDGGLLEDLVKTHDVEVFLLKGSSTERLWTQGDTTEEKIEFEAKADDPTTDLSTGIRKSLSTEVKSNSSNPDEPDNQSQRTAVVLFSDGLHNDGESPLHTAKLFGGNDIGINTIGMGGTTPPPDLAILDVNNPESVYVDDRINGTILLKDNIEKGRAFQIRIEHEGRVVWEKNKLFTHNLQRRRIPFDFPIKKIVEEQIKQTGKDFTINSLPLSMKVIIDPLEEEVRKDNNDAPLVFKAITRRHRMLLIDGRPRWETRYIRNLFDRGERWEVNAIFAGPSTDTATIPRGNVDGQFPASRDALYAYDLILFGETPVELFNEGELSWIKDFVEKRGGGIIFIDGPRQKLKQFAGTPIIDLAPVEWVENAELRFPKWLQITERGASQSALTLIPEPTENERLWRNLPQPHWVAPVTALPGTDVLLEAAVGETRTPVIVTRKFGAGKVFYSGFDGSWRWRYGVAERYHQKYWHQVAEWIMERPFAVSDDHVSIDAGATVYRTGDSANLRVRLRDSEGKPITEATAEALIWKEGRIVSRVNLSPDPNAGGLFRGKSAALTEGQHEVTVRVTGFAEDQTQVRTEFVVQSPETGETALLACNEKLLQEIAKESGGQYLREEQAGQLTKILDPLSTGRIVESNTVLWQSYWWFGAIILLLSGEWFLRKRVGMM
jgi:uncharacterized membrane protein